jgi:hypothetical protein
MRSDPAPLRRVGVAGSADVPRHCTGARRGGHSRGHRAFGVPRLAGCSPPQLWLLAPSRPAARPRDRAVCSAPSPRVPRSRVPRSSCQALLPEPSRRVQQPVLQRGADDDVPRRTPVDEALLTCAPGTGVDRGAPRAGTWGQGVAGSTPVSPTGNRSSEAGHPVTGGPPSAHLRVGQGVTPGVLPRAARKARSAVGRSRVARVASKS